ncbi:phage holin family protein [Christensenellaceae bacterium NSJ-63]|uniref:Phage holin family protein n=1 Tax=Guopingia tenuis TaxID=2763656 RepID=A0A926DHU1_9FIRM|nr:phage holin family protein [Guopingia tenuis]MBC8538121.1 phage holin family protein [Guopingia tenuis]DAU49043.1 MAG TPA: holin [Caudoviricetes sp.]
MNLKVRMKNWSFWVSVLISIGAPILAYFGLTAADITTWAALGRVLLEAVSNPYVVGLVLVSLYNALIDPTTKGIKDSAQALTYEKPKE